MVVFCKRLEIQKTASLKQVSGDYDSLIFITAEMREDISWWRHNANKYPVLLSPHLPAITITTDAILVGVALAMGSLQAVCGLKTSSHYIKTV